jgi:hypothetical protein
MRKQVTIKREEISLWRNSMNCNFAKSHMTNFMSERGLGESNLFCVLVIS